MNRPIPYHPLIAGVLPVALLLSANASNTPSINALRTAAVSLAFAVLLWAALALIMRSVNRAAAPATIVIALFATLLPVSRAVSAAVGIEHSVYRWSIGGLVVIAWIVLLAVALRYALSLPDRKPLTRGLNLALVCLIVVPLANIIRVDLTANRSATLVSPPETGETPAVHRPDVYYILPDGYARSDVLRDLYGYDNRAFLQHLEALDFVVCKDSTANYCQTSLSLASSLNMSHISVSADEVDSTDRTGAHMAFLRNEVMKALGSAGYRTVAYASGYSLSEMHTADDYRALGPNEFEAIAGATFFGFAWGIANERLGGGVTPYMRITSNLAQLGEERGGDVPVFVFAHLLAPHPPFVLNADGTRRHTSDLSTLDGSHRIPRLSTAEEYRAKYLNQLKGLNVHLIRAINRIIEAADNDCIIIIQSDHGPGSELDWDDPAATNMRERMAILNAYLVPEEVREKLYPQITPVNSFRLVLNHIFDTDHPLVEDSAHFSGWMRPFDLIDVTDSARVHTGEAAQ